MNDRQWTTLLHDWTVLAEYDAGYTVVRCGVCGEESLADLPLREAS